MSEQKSQPHPQQQQQIKNTYTIGLISDTHVGKTNIMNRFFKNQFVMSPPVSDDIYFLSKEVTPTGTTTPIQLVVYRIYEDRHEPTIVPAFYNQFDGFMLAFDITDKESLLSLQRYKTAIHAHADPHAPCMLLGNKADRVDHKQVSEEDVMLFIGNSKLECVEVSAVDNTNITFAFDKMVDMITKKRASVKLGDTKESKNKSITKAKCVT